MNTDKTVLVLVAAYRNETGQNEILIGEGYSLVEAVVRAIEHSLSEEEFLNILHIYGTDDFAGLSEWYLSRDIHISQPMIINDEHREKESYEKNNKS